MRSEFSWQESTYNRVKDHHVEEGVDELDLDKLPLLLRLRYNAISDVAAELGTPVQIREVFVRFQKYLYAEGQAAEA